MVTFLSSYRLFITALFFFSFTTTSSKMEQFQVLQNDWFWSKIESSLINGYHLVCCCAEIPGVFNIVRDSEGRIIATTGVAGALLNWLSQAYHFTFECSQNMPRTTSVENSATTFGWIHYLETGKCEMIVSPMVMRHDRFLHFDMIPVFHSPYAMLIPAPKVSSTNINAVWKPFQPTVWITLLAFLILTPLALTFLNYRKTGLNYVNALDSYGMFVIQNMFSQSASAPLSDGNKKLKMRLVIGVWCLASIWITTAYSSVLVSFIMAPHYKPLVDTVEDLAETPDVYPLVAKNLGADVSILTSNDPLMKAIAEKLKKDPVHTRCSNLTACVEQVKNGGSYVFIDALQIIGLGVHQDFVRTGKCNFAYAKEYFFSQYLALGIRKEHLLTESINIGVLRAIETGLLDEWTKRKQPNSDARCNHFHQSKPSKDKHLARISLANLMGPFMILLVGSISSILTFGIEKLVHFLFRRNNVVVV